MKIRFVFPIALASLTLVLCMAFAATAQRGGQEHGGGQAHGGIHANQGHIPEAGPPHRDGGARPEVERRDGGRINSMPHVNHDHWYGHDRPNDRRFALAHPFEHGRFEHFGPSYRYHVERFDRDHHRFWFPGGFSFEIAAWDWPIADDWCWDCDADNFVVYDDPDHSGWYLIYNVATGAYIHAQYMGS